MNENVKKPKVRFKGYEDAWEQRKVGDFLTESREAGHKGDIAHKITVKLWGKGVYEKNDAGSANTQYFIRHAGQFIYSKLDFLNCAFGVVPEELESFETTADVPAFDCNGINPYFMFYVAIQPNFYEKNGMIADGSRKAKRIHADTFLNMPFFVPNLEEQNKIVNLLSEVDDLLTLHQRECEQAKKYKKYMLQKMFPQNGSNVPEIRFSGFTHPWEQRKLGDVFKEYSEKNHIELPALTIIQGGGTVKREDSDRNLMYDESNLSNYKMVRKDDFIVHLRSFEGGLEKSSLDGIISPAYHTFHSDVADSRFYYPYFRSHEFINYKLVPHVYGIRDGRSIDIDGMKTIEIPYTSLEEQRRIGDYLESLDHLITLHQQKCEELQKIKKFMLQNMFV